MPLTLMRWRNRHSLAFKQQPFEDQTGGKPAGSIVQADHFSDIPTGALVVPGAQFPSAQQNTGNEFAGENEAGIDQTAEDKTSVTHEPAERGEQGCQTVDGEHPDRGNAGQFKISSAEGLECGEDDLQKPAEQPAVDIVVE